MSTPIAEPTNAEILAELAQARADANTLETGLQSLRSDVTSIFQSLKDLSGEAAEHVSSTAYTSLQASLAHLEVSCMHWTRSLDEIGKIGHRVIMCRPGAAADEHVCVMVSCYMNCRDDLRLGSRLFIQLSNVQLAAVTLATLIRRVSVAGR